jgi:hypothetical protein
MNGFGLVFILLGLVVTVWLISWMSPLRMVPTVDPLTDSDGSQTSQPRPAYEEMIESANDAVGAIEQ